MAELAKNDRHGLVNANAVIFTTCPIYKRRFLKALILLDTFFQLGPKFYLIAIPAVLIVGLSKGGMGGGLAMLGTPLLSLTISPVQAAAILLPVLLIMDAISLINYRGVVNWQVIRTMVPGAMIGITIGWYTASMVSDDWTRILVGVIALTFAIYQKIKDWFDRAAAEQNALLGGFWGAMAGFTSFISHAGSPPFQAYTIPLKLEKTYYVGTSVVFFATINIIKVLPYFLLGQFSNENLSISLTLLPVAVLGVLFGVWVVKKISQEIFYNITYLVMAAIGIKLIWDGKAALAFLT